MTEGEDPNEYVLDSIGQSEREENSFYSMNAFSIPFTILKNNSMANVKWKKLFTEQFFKGSKIPKSPLYNDKNACYRWIGCNYRELRFDDL